MKFLNIFKNRIIFIALIILFAPGLLPAGIHEVIFYKANLIYNQSVNGDAAIYGYYAPVHGDSLYYPISTDTAWISPDTYAQRRIKIILENDINNVVLDYDTVVSRITPVACTNLVSSSSWLGVASDNEVYQNVIISDISTYDDRPLENRTPVVLVHGWQVFQNNVINMVANHPELETWKSLRSYIKQNHNESFKIFQFRYPSFNHVYKNGALLSEAIKTDEELKNRKDLIIIAHSMGGLVSLSAMFEHGLNKRVKKLITLATPHHGVIGIDAEGDLGVTFTSLFDLIKKGASTATAYIAEKGLNIIPGAGILSSKGIDKISDFAIDRLSDNFQNYYLSTQGIKNLAFDGQWQYMNLPWHEDKARIYDNICMINEILGYDKDSNVLYEIMNSSEIYGGSYDDNKYLASLNQNNLSQIYNKTLFYGGRLANESEPQINKNMIFSALGRMLNIEGGLKNDGIVPVESAFLLPDGVCFDNAIDVDGINNHTGNYQVDNYNTLHYRYFYDYDHGQMADGIKDYDKINPELNNSDPLFEHILLDLNDIRANISQTIIEDDEPDIYADGIFQDLQVIAGNSIKFYGTIKSNNGNLSQVTAVIIKPDGSQDMTTLTAFPNAASFDLNNFIFDSNNFSIPGIYVTGIWAKSIALPEPKQPLAVFNIRLSDDTGPPIISYLKTDKRFYNQDELVEISWQSYDPQGIWYEKIEVYQENNLIKTVYDSRTGGFESTNKIFWNIQDDMPFEGSYYVMLETADNSYYKNVKYAQSLDFIVYVQDDYAPNVSSVSLNKNTFIQNELLEVTYSARDDRNIHHAGIEIWTGDMSKPVLILDGYHVINLSTIDETLTYVIPDLIPSGQYRIKVWIADSNDAENVRNHGLFSDIFEITGKNIAEPVSWEGEIITTNNSDLPYAGSTVRTESSTFSYDFRPAVVSSNDFSYDLKPQVDQGNIFTFQYVFGALDTQFLEDNQLSDYESIFLHPSTQDSDKDGIFDINDKEPYTEKIKYILDENGKLKIIQNYINLWGTTKYNDPVLLNNDSSIKTKWIGAPRSSDLLGVRKISTNITIDARQINNNSHAFTFQFSTDYNDDESALQLLDDIADNPFVNDSDGDGISDLNDKDSQTDYDQVNIWGVASFNDPCLLNSDSQITTGWIGSPRASDLTGIRVVSNTIKLDTRNNVVDSSDFTFQFSVNYNENYTSIQLINDILNHPSVKDSDGDGIVDSNDKDSLNKYDKVNIWGVLSFNDKSLVNNDPSIPSGWIGAPRASELIGKRVISDPVKIDLRQQFKDSEPFLIDFRKDSDNDGIIDEQDSFPTDPAASIDHDNDNRPDMWNENASELEISSSSLILDQYLDDPKNLPVIVTTTSLTITED